MPEATASRSAESTGFRHTKNGYVTSDGQEQVRCTFYVTREQRKEMQRRVIETGASGISDLIVSSLGLADAGALVSDRLTQRETAEVSS